MEMYDDRKCYLQFYHYLDLRLLFFVETNNKKIDVISHLLEHL